MCALFKKKVTDYGSAIYDTNDWKRKYFDKSKSNLQLFMSSQMKLNILISGLLQSVLPMGLANLQI